ncbi:MAG TPA: hypothetical protein VLD67_07495 [Vicinamibacterales bacterium]|nr:hypothetical protein [Vicinamibacterales bacterium]
MKRHIASIAVVASGMLILTGCLQKETDHSLYLSPDGKLAWSILERDVRSDERDLAKRTAEEQEYLDRLAAGLHPPLLAFRQLAGSDTSARLIGPRRPYAVLTESRFDAIDEVVRRILADLRMPGDVTLARHEESLTLSVALYYDFDWELDDGSAVCALLDYAARYRIILTEGRFVEATGFSLEDDSTAAVLRRKAFKPREGERGVTLSLTWRP